MNSEDIPVMAKNIKQIFGNPPAATSKLTAPKTSLYWAQSNTIHRYWERVGRYRNADRIDRNSACSGLAALWRCGDTMHGSILRDRHTPLEWTLMNVWPKHGRPADVATWRIACAMIGGIRTLAMNDGIVDPEDMMQIQDDLTFLCILAIGRGNLLQEQTP